jgi:hypothetical protein
LVARGSGGARKPRKIHTPAEIRTRDPGIRNPMLYPTELRARREFEDSEDGCERTGKGRKPPLSVVLQAVVPRSRKLRRNPKGPIWLWKKPSMAFYHESEPQKAKVFQGSQKPHPAADEFFQRLLCVACPRSRRQRDGTRAIIRNGPPLPPSIFIGSATTVAPTVGSRSSAATFSKIGTSAPHRTTCASKWVDGP